MTVPVPPSDYSRLILSRRIIRQSYQLGLVIVAGILLMIAGYRLTTLWLVPEVTLVFAHSDAAFGSLFASLAEKVDPSLVRIQVKEVSDARAVDAALEGSTADFAVVRPDVNFPERAMVAATLQESALIILTWGSSKISRVDQLAGRRVGTVAMDVGSRETLQRILGFHRIAGTEISEIAENPEAIRSAISTKRVDALAIFGHASLVRQLAAELADLKLSMVPMAAGDISQTLPGIGSASIAAKSLPNALPEEEVQTVSTSVLLVARRDVDRATVNTFLQSLFSRRPALARDHELAWQMKGPGDDSTVARLPNHRGALDYYNREQQTFMDLYGDWIWLGLFAAGGVSSAGAWLTQTLSRRRKQLVESILDRLLEILGEARDAESVEVLDKLTVEVDGLVTHAIRQARWRATEPMTTSALTLAIDSSRSAIADRRRALIDNDVVRPSAARRASP